MDKSVKLAETEKELMKDSEFKTDYKIISRLIKALTEQNITQDEPAKRIGTKKSCISRVDLIYIPIPLS